MRQTRSRYKSGWRSENNQQLFKKKIEALLKWKRYLFKVTTQPGRRTVIGP